MTLSKDLNASSIPSPVPPHTYKKGKEKTSGNELHCTEETTSLLRFKEETPPEKNACSAKVSLAAKNKTIPIATDRRHKPYEQIQNKKGLQEMEPRRKKCTDVTGKRQRITKGRVEKSTFDCPAIRQSLAAPDESTTRPRNAKQATSGREKKQHSTRLSYYDVSFCWSVVIGAAAAVAQAMLPQSDPGCVVAGVGRG